MKKNLLGSNNFPCDTSKDTRFSFINSFCYLVTSILYYSNFSKANLFKKFVVNDKAFKKNSQI